MQGVVVDVIIQRRVRDIFALAIEGADYFRPECNAVLNEIVEGTFRGEGTCADAIDFGEVTHRCYDTGSVRVLLLASETIS